MKEEDLAH